MLKKQKKKNRNPLIPDYDFLFDFMLISKQHFNHYHSSLATWELKPTSYGLFQIFGQNFKR